MKKGFTLAEVLITLSIVGIVAVLTVPSIMTSYQNRLYTSQLQKVYAQITGAVEMVMHDEGVDNFYETKAAMAQVCSNANTCTAGAGYFLGKYFGPVKKNCGNPNAANACIVGSASNPYRKLDGGNSGGITSDYCVQTTSDAAVCMKKQPNFIYICVDVNGAKKPNIAGRDLFCMDIKSNGAVTDYGSESADPAVAGAQPEDCNTAFAGYNTAGCMAAVMEAGWKMEY